MNRETNDKEKQLTKYGQAKLFDCANIFGLVIKENKDKLRDLGNKIWLEVTQIVKLTVKEHPIARICNHITNERAEAISNLKPLATRVVNALQITDAKTKRVDDAKGFNQKFQGPKSKKIETVSDLNSAAPKTISTSQQSYDQ